LRKELTPIDYFAIRRLFIEPPATKGLKPESKPFQKDSILSFLVDEHSFSPERVRSAIGRLDKVETTQTDTLEKWFG
jgi:flap endonuclease-1